MIILSVFWKRKHNRQEARDMVKVITLLKRKKGITLEEFSRHWQEKHGAIVLKTVPGIKRYIQNHAVRLSAGGEPKIDGIAEVWYDDLEAWRQFADLYWGDKGKAIRDDEETFLDKSKLVFFVAEEKVIKP